MCLRGDHCSPVFLLLHAYGRGDLIRVKHDERDRAMVAEINSKNAASTGYLNRLFSPNSIREDTLSVYA